MYMYVAVLLFNGIAGYSIAVRDPDDQNQNAEESSSKELGFAKSVRPGIREDFPCYI